MEIEDYLKSHLLINPYSIEKELGMPIGTIRLGRHIPDKYREKITELLSDYGYNVSVEKEKPAEVVKTTTGKRYYTVKEGKLYSIKTDVEEKRWDGKMGIVTRKVDDIPDGTTVTLG